MSGKAKTTGDEDAAAVSRQKKLEWAYRILMALITLVAIPAVGWSLKINTEMATHLTAWELTSANHERRITELEASVVGLEERVRALERGQADVALIERDVEHVRELLGGIEEGLRDLVRQQNGNHNGG